MDMLRAKFFNARYATPDDAQFLLDLRLARGDFLHQTSANLSKQVAYLQRSVLLRQAREEAYLIIESKERVTVGCFRLTELSSRHSLNYESLVIAEGQSPNLAINVTFCVYQLAFERLAKRKVGPFYVINGNDRVMGLFQTMGIAERGASKFEDGKEYLRFEAKRGSYFARQGFFKSMEFGIVDLSHDLLQVCRAPIVGTSGVLSKIEERMRVEPL